MAWTPQPPHGGAPPPWGPPPQPPGPPGWVPQPLPPAPPRQPPKRSNTLAWVLALGGGAIVLLGVCGALAFVGYLGFEKTRAQNECVNLTGAARIPACHV